jgi:uncharacterized membrane protein
VTDNDAPSSPRAQRRDGLTGASPTLVRLLQGLEHASAVDPLADLLAPVADVLLSSQRVRDTLRGAWMGHALHPLLTDIPLGAWISASMLDLLGGPRSRPAAEALLTVGLVTALPTAAAGLAEWQSTSGGDRRVGAIHAAVNVGALALYGSSLIARRRGRYGAGVALALAGTAVASVSGYLGGHLAIARKVGSRDPAFSTPT